MGLKELFNNPKKHMYEVDTLCENCGYTQTTFIPKGRMIEEYLDDERCICHNCACPTLVLKPFKKPSVEGLEQDNIPKKHYPKPATRTPTLPQMRGPKPFFNDDGTGEQQAKKDKLWS